MIGDEVDNVNRLTKQVEFIAPIMFIHPARWARYLDRLGEQSANQETFSNATSSIEMMRGSDIPDGLRAAETASEDPPTLESGLQLFEAGTLIFYSDRVELCGVKICGDQKKHMRRRQVLELLAKQIDGTFISRVVAMGL